MKTTVTILLVFAVCITVSESCKKSGGSDVTGGGKGGNATILVAPEHHGSFVDTCTVYIKYGTNDAPANGIYDDSAVCVMYDTTPIATFSNLKIGLYYIYGEGYHGAYSPPYIKGGLPVTVAQEAPDTVYLPTYNYNK